VIGLGTVWMRVQTTNAASRERRLEQERAALERTSNELQGQIAALLNPEFLQNQNRTFALGLVPTNETQVIRVSESVTRLLAAKRHTTLADPAAGRVVAATEPAPLFR
jgi:hypothetical protein